MIIGSTVAALTGTGSAGSSPEKTWEKFRNSWSLSIDIAISAVYTSYSEVENGTKNRRPSHDDQS